MKRCPQCNRIEPDDKLAFCRVDGATLVNDSVSIGDEVGTIKLGSGSVGCDNATSIMPNETSAVMSWATVATTVLSGTAIPTTTRELRKPRRRGIALGLIALVVLLLAIGAFLFWPDPPPPFQSIAVMPFENGSGNPDFEYLSDGMGDGGLHASRTDSWQECRYAQRHLEPRLSAFMK